MKKRMLRIAALVMAATMSISLAACGSKPEQKSSNENASEG